MASIDKRPNGRYQARWGAVPQKIGRNDILARVKKLSDTRAPISVAFVYRWVAGIFKAAVRDRLIAASPCIRIVLPKKLVSR